MQTKENSVVVTGGKTPGEQFDELILLLAKTPKEERDSVVAAWLQGMTKEDGTGWEPATVQAVAAAAQVAVMDPRAR